MTTQTDNTTFIKKGQNYILDFSDVTSIVYVRNEDRTQCELWWSFGKDQTDNFESIWIRDGVEKSRVIRLYRWRPDVRPTNERTWRVSDSYSNDIDDASRR